jgi:hypothetical protein
MAFAVAVSCGGAVVALGVLYQATGTDAAVVELPALPVLDKPIDLYVSTAQICPTNITQDVKVSALMADSVLFPKGVHVDSCAGMILLNFSWAFHAWDKNAKSYRVNGITASTTTREAGWVRMGFEYNGHCVWKTVYALFVRGLTEPLIGAVYTAKTMGVTLEIAPTGTRMFLPDGTIVPVDTSTGVTRCMHVKFGNGKDPKFGALRDTMNGKHVTFDGH